MQVTRRQFFRVCAADMGKARPVVPDGILPGNALAEVRGSSSSPRRPGTHNTCPYCSVACGILIYSLGDRSKNAQSRIFHVRAIRTIRSIAARSARRAPACST